MNVALSVIRLWFILRLERDRHDEAAFRVLPVSPAEAYVQHFSSVHAADISQFHPAYAGVESRDLAYCVLRGDETVGVVVVRREGDEARVQLD